MLYVTKFLSKVVIKYESLVNNEDLSASIEAGYGFNGYEKNAWRGCMY